MRKTAIEGNGRMFGTMFGTWDHEMLQLLNSKNFLSVDGISSSSLSSF